MIHGRIINPNSLTTRDHGLFVTDRGFLLRIFDILISILLIMFFAPLMVFISVVVKLITSGPVIFKQQRVGLNGRTFQIYKFCTMVRDAERIKDTLLARNEGDGPIFRMQDDPRITRVGKLLRRFSLDELPQLFNVLEGEMRLVGPRPGLPLEVKKYKDWHNKRLSVKPGIFSPWHTFKKRYTVSFDEWVRSDLEYIQHRSFWFDLKMLGKASISVVRWKGW